MRAVVADILCTTPYYSGALVRSQASLGLDVELASPMFYLEPHFLDDVPRAPWILDLVLRAARPRALRLAARSVEASLNIKDLLGRVAADTYDVVHLQWIPFEEHTSLFMRLLRSRCDATGTLLVHTAHNAVPHDRLGTDVARIRQNLDLAHLIVAQTDHVAAELAGLVGTKTPTVVIPHGPLFAERELPDRAAAAQRLGITHPGPIVLFLGLLRPYKGLDLLADAWPDVKAAVPDARLIVAGRRADRSVAGDLARLTRQSGVSLVDHYLSVATMLDYYAASDLVVLPYRRISQSGAFMTATGLGRPTVMTPLAGLLEQARGLDSAVFADEISASAFARSVIASLHRVEELGRAAAKDRAWIAESPSGWPNVARRTIDAYEHGLRSLRSTM